MLVINLLGTLGWIIAFFHFSSIIDFLYFSQAEISSGAEIAVQVSDVLEIGFICYVSL